MYPPKNPDEGRAEVSQDNARDIVEAIDALVLLRIQQQVYNLNSCQDAIDMAKRTITDYLLVTDPRAGVFRKPE